jgi:hypothetical protein
MAPTDIARELTGAASNDTPELADRSGCNYRPTHEIKGLRVEVHKECIKGHVHITVQFWYEADRRSPRSFAVRYHDPSKRDGTSGSRILVQKYLSTRDSSGTTIETTVLARNYKDYRLELISNEDHCKVYAQSAPFHYNPDFPQDRRCKPY